MEAFNGIIVKVDKAYKDSITLKNGFKLLLNPLLSQVKDTIRYGEVISVPNDCGVDVVVGDTLFFHHGIVNVTVMNNRPNLESSYLIDSVNHLYTVPIDETWPLAYAVLRDGEFKCLPGINFIKPVKEKKYETFLYIPNNEKIKENVGEMAFVSPSMEGLVKVGDKVVFKKGHDYSFTINGEEYFRVFDRFIYSKYE